jgi:glucose-1-phosphate thymidylyltransferase
MEIVGLIPAAGVGSRLKQYPGSKELIPVGSIDKTHEEKTGSPNKPVILYLIERMISADIKNILIIINRQKWDIVNYLGGGGRFGIEIAYLVQEKLLGLPYAISLASPWIMDRRVLFGMPDTIFEPFDAFNRLLTFHKSSETDMTLGLFPTTTPQDFGMVNFDNFHNYLYSIDKPEKSDLKYMWGIVCWNPDFTEFITKYISGQGRISHEIVLGDVFEAARLDGLRIKVLPYEGGNYIDIGTPKGLTKALSNYGN